MLLVNFKQACLTYPACPESWQRPDHSVKASGKFFRQLESELKGQDCADLCQLSLQSLDLCLEIQRLMGGVGGSPAAGRSPDRAKHDIQPFT